jgi:hypothetical protein
LVVGSAGRTDRKIKKGKMKENKIESKMIMKKTEQPRNEKNKIRISRK